MDGWMDDGWMDAVKTEECLSFLWKRSRDNFHFKLQTSTSQKFKPQHLIAVHQQIKLGYNTLLVVHSIK